MTKTEHYQLNQWDPEDRILRVDFNADNAALDAALKSNADAVGSETTNRKSADTKIRTDFAAADNTVRAEFAAADAELQSAIDAEADARAAADDTLRSENMLVKLRSLTTTSNTTQVNLSMTAFDLTQYSEVIIIPRMRLDTATKMLIFRVNSIASDYYHGTTEQEYFTYFYPTYDYQGNRGSPFAKMILYPSAETLALWSSYGGNTVTLSPDKLAPADVTTLNFVSPSATILAGSKITVYGVKL